MIELNKSFNYLMDDLDYIPDLKCVPDLECVLHNKQFPFRSVRFFFRTMGSFLIVSFVLVKERSFPNGQP